jgi:hypothetical protein
MTPPTAESGNQVPFIDAAVAAGVKRFIPAEWGHDTRPGKLSGPLADMLSGKTKAGDYLIEKAKAHPDFTWTGISTRMFLDWVSEPFDTNSPTRMIMTMEINADIRPIFYLSPWPTTTSSASTSPPRRP